MADNGQEAACEELVLTMNGVAVASSARETVQMAGTDPAQPKRSLASSHASELDEDTEGDGEGIREKLGLSYRTHTTTATDGDVEIIGQGTPPASSGALQGITRKRESKLIFSVGA